MRATPGPVALIASHIPLGPALIVAISFAFGCAPSKRTYEERTSDGTLTRDGQLAGDVQVGPWTYHYPDGRKKAEGRFRDDHQDGLWTYWYENGAKEMEGSFAAERRTGLWRYWHPNGSLRAEGRFENDREAGRWIFYRPDGTLDRSGAFRDGARVGRWTYYDTSGDPRASGHYIEDRKVGPWRFWNAQGRISERSAPLPDECVLVFERGQGSFVRREGLIANGRPMGRWETRHRDGETRMAGDMADGVPDGIWEAFAPDGKLIAFGPVARGRMVGAWTIVSATGKSSALEAEGIRAPAHVRGEWSSDSLFRERAPAAALASWLAEAAAPLEPDADEDPFMPVAGLSPIEFADDEPGAPTVHVQPALTVSQAQNLERIVEGYTSGGLAYDGPSHLPAVSFQAGGPDYSERESRRRLPPGDEELARSYLGKPLPEELLLDPQGKPVDLSSFRGRENILLVILRGFDGRVCEYCAGQT
ncbi:MAG TPA: hypothetical protein VK116_02555, partial [Planctomycetota bacterium]|nr:hypothetical protein [Planctomycetota bacterium]